MERNESSLRARRAARRRRKPTCCRSNSSKRLSAALASIGGDLSQQRRPQEETAGVEGLIVGHGQEQPKVVARKQPPASEVAPTLRARAPEHAPQHVIALDDVVTQRGDDMDEHHRGEHIGENHVRLFDPLPH